MKSKINILIKCEIKYKSVDFLWYYTRDRIKGINLIVKIKEAVLLIAICIVLLYVIYGDISI